MNNLFSGSGDLLLRFILLAGDDATSRGLAAAGIIAAVKKQRPGAEMHRYSAEDTPFDDFCERIISPSLLSPLRPRRRVLSWRPGAAAREPSRPSLSRRTARAS